MYYHSHNDYYDNYHANKAYKGIFGDIKKFIKKAIARLIGNPETAEDEDVRDTILRLVRMQAELQASRAQIAKISLKGWTKEFSEKKELRAEDVEEFISVVNINLDMIVGLMDYSKTKIGEYFPELHNAIYAQAIPLINDLKNILNITHEGFKVESTPDDPDGLIEAIDMIRIYRNQMLELHSDMSPEEMTILKKRRKGLVNFLLEKINERRSEIVTHLESAMENAEKLSNYIDMAVSVIDAERIQLAEIKAY